MTTDKLTIYFIRHGKTEWNLTGQMQGWCDSPLVEEGISGAKAVGAVLKNVTFAAVFTSPSKRTQDTAHLILGDEQAKLTPLEDLREMNFGLWEGVRITELDEKYPDERQEFMTSPATFTAEVNGGETYYQLAKRLMNALKTIQTNCPSGNVLVVSHGMALTLLLHLLSGGTVADHRNKGTRIMNTSISVVDIINGELQVRELNKIDHLIR